MQRIRTIAVIGLGYVGLEVLAAFGKKNKVIGFDIDAKRVAELQQSHDKNLQVAANEITQTNIVFSTDAEVLKNADFYIITVPTPVDSSKRPDFTMLISASKIVGRYLKKGDIVVYESTVYPGATEEICAPVLEQESKLICGKDFFIGYSPERIDPSNKNHTIYNTIKIVSGQTPAVLDEIAKIYEMIVEVGVYRASSIRVAEAAKVIENVQRDLNISLVNEFALILHRLNVDTREVLEAASTKWNFIPFFPGLVGGHCIGVDPYYLTYKAEQVGYHPDVILAGRRVNDLIGRFVVESTIKQLIKLGITVRNSRIAVLGLTFKENCTDLRNTKVIDMIKELSTYEIEVLVCDPVADAKEVKNIYGINLVPWEKIKDVDAIIFAVSHDQFKKLTATEIKNKLKSPGLIMDVKGILNPNDFQQEKDILFWRF